MAEAATAALPRREATAVPAAGRRPIPRPIAGAALAAALGLAGTLLGPVPRLLVWNASPSSPVGLYWVARTGEPRPGDRVVAWPPAWAGRIAAKRTYLPLGVPLVKQVAAVAGARVCATGRLLFVEGAPAATRRSRDPSGRTMPWWTGCRRLGPGELFLLSPGRPDAFDGRYFGVTVPGEILGRARLLWAA
jgi:conjugative transfer signal peptidase TraF